MDAIHGFILSTVTTANGTALPSNCHKQLSVCDTYVVCSKHDPVTYQDALTAANAVSQFLSYQVFFSTNDPAITNNYGVLFTLGNGEISAGLGGQEVCATYTPELDKQNACVYITIIWKYQVTYLDTDETCLETIYDTHELCFDPIIVDPAIVPTNPDGTPIEMLCNKGEIKYDLSGYDTGSIAGNTINTYLSEDGGDYESAAALVLDITDLCVTINAERLDAGKEYCFKFSVTPNLA